jgi:Peptidase family M1 domain
MTQVITAVLGLWCALVGAAWAQTGANAPQPATSAPPAPTAGPTATAPLAGPGLALYRQLRDVGLDPAAVYNVRDAAIQREDLHITLDDGTLAFVRSVDGRVTGAFFEGEGEVLLIPPDQAERGSLALFTGAAILEEQFTTAYFRFNDRTAEELQPALRPEEEAQAFVEKYDKAARTLAEADALRLMTTYLNQQTHGDDRLFRARLQGVRLGIFDIYFDTLISEQIAVLKLTYVKGTGYYDVLCSFPMRSARNSGGVEKNPTLSPPNPGSEKAGPPAGGAQDEAAALRITKYTIKARIEPPHVLAADVTLDIDVRRGGQRIEFFELSRYLKLTAAEADGKAIEFLQNEAIKGSALARRGNDVIAAVFPEALRSGQKLRMKFTYAGNVLSDAGGGLVYVGARGVWYPNRGLTMADYDLEFRYPQEWTLVATGKRVSQARAGTEQVSHYVSERPMPVAGFNLGRYSVASATAANNVLVEAYASAGLESAFPQQQQQQVVVVPPLPREPRPVPPIVLAPRSAPAPASHAEAVAQRSARAIDFFARNFGPYPYSSLTLSQMPGTNSQGWPGLIFLSSYAFLSPEELRGAQVGPEATLAYSGFMQAHETAHQWWGDLVGWKTYRDQWLVEALASYSAILAYENDRAADCKQTLRNYRAELFSKNAEGEEYARAGPVTLGLRLSSSHFPDGYDVVSYGRGAWLLHMLRSMMRDAAGGSDEPFLRALRKLRDRYQDREMTTSDFMRVMEEEMPDSLRYEGSHSLEWFLESWVKGTAIPRLELKDVKVVRRGAGALVTGKILQTEAPDELVTSVPVYASVGGRHVLLGRVFADGKETGFRLSAPAGAKNLVLDPYDTVLKR